MGKLSLIFISAHSNILYNFYLSWGSQFTSVLNDSIIGC